MKSAITKYRERRSPKKYALAILFTILSTIVFIILLKFLWTWSTKIFRVFETGRRKFAKKLKVERSKLMPVNLLKNIIKLTSNITRIGLFFFLFYLYITVILGFFPRTKLYKMKLTEQLQDAIIAAGKAVIDYIPHLIFVFVIAITTYYINQIIRHVFYEIQEGNIVLKGFYRDWAHPTDKIIRFFIFAIAFAAIFPHLPGANTGAFKGISVFLGVLVSLGSTAIIANIVAGILLIYTRAFKIGDIIKIADTIGRVHEATILVTRLKTVKNVVTSIPNSIVLGSHIINYSSASRDTGLIVHTSITIGYDVPWREVHKLMLEAAFVTENILKDPNPFILQTALGDYSVTYELNAYTDVPQSMPKLYSDLHQNIMDKFNESEIEIMSPGYIAIRDGNTTTTPKEYRPKSYTPQGFYVKK